MNLMQLKYVLEIEKTGSITSAAQNLYMSQPNLSKAVKELEEKIGTKIFVRSAKGVKITRSGGEFLAYARTIVSQMEELEAIYRPNANKKVSLNFCMPRATYLSVAFTDFLNKIDDESHIAINIKERNSQDTINYVSLGEADLGIIRYQDVYENYFLYMLGEKGLEYETILEFNQLLLMSKDNPLANYNVIPDNMLSGYTEVIHGDLQAHTMSMHQIKRVTPAQVPDKRIYLYERGSQLDILQNVKNTYMWVSPMPQEFLESHDLVEKRCPSQSAVNKDLLIYKKGHVFSESEKTLIECIKNVINEKKK